jgi:hypothetical protein
LQELITKCTILTEKALKAAITFITLLKSVILHLQCLQELITKCTVVTEKALKAAILRTTARKRAFKRLPDAEQEAAAAEVVGERGDSAAAFFDLLALRKTGRNRVTQVSTLMCTHYCHAALATLLLHSLTCWHCARPAGTG